MPAPARTGRKRTKAVALQTQSLRPLPAPKSDFIGLEGMIHLATGGEPPLLVAHRAAFERFARDKAGGFDGYWTHWAVDDAVRAAVARRARADTADIATLRHHSAGITRYAPRLVRH